MKNKIFIPITLTLLFAVFVGGDLPRDSRFITREDYRAWKFARQEHTKQPSDWFMHQRTWPSGVPNREAIAEARRQAHKMRLRARGRTLDESWTFAGPSNVGGRITALAVHPSAPDTVYAAAALGGVLKSIDGGYHYEVVFEENYSLAAGALAMDPVNPRKVWLGTGEANASGDSYSGTGVYLTEDGGRSWRHMGLENIGRVGEIAVDPSDPDRVFVAAAGELFGTNPERGLYRTTDGGQTWEQVLYLSDSTGCIDVEITYQCPDTVYAAMWERIRRPYERNVGGITSGLWRSVDGGDSWQQLTNGLPVGSTVGRGGVAVSASNPLRVYASFADHPGYLIGIYRSDDAGETWSHVGNPPSDDFYSSFGWYFGKIYADPVNPDVVYVQGVDMFRSADGGTTWYTVFGSAHVDHHALWINPGNPSHVLTGHDGGVNISNNAGISSAAFASLPITQFYAVNADPSLPYRLYGGTQDNSTPRTLGGGTGDWDVIYYGDGFYCAVDPRDSDVIYAEWQYGGLSKSINGGWNWQALYYTFSSDRTNWSTPFELNPSDPDELILGTYRLWQSEDGGSHWNSISSDLTNGPGPGNLVFGTITTLAHSPDNPNVIYAGTDDGNVWVRMPGGSWVDRSAGLPERWVTRVAPHPDSAGVVYVALSGYREQDYQPHLLKSADYGVNWQDIGAELPEGPVNDVIIDPQSPCYLYAGTDFGVYYSPDCGQTWQILGNGLPQSAVMDLHLIESTRTLVAGTHGRSMWTYPVDTQTPSTPVELTVIYADGEAILRWSHPDENARFNIYGAELNAETGDFLASTADTFWVDFGTGQRPAKFFYYVTAEYE